jgi:uncharacterized protein (TIGR02646 family)
VVIKITKGKEPAEWTKIKSTPGINFESADKTALRQALIDEQGWVCAYCMRRINYVAGAVTDTRIEHLKPQSISIDHGHPEETLAYSNMVLCCNGNIAGDGKTHCDTSKGDREISFTPFDQAVIDTISYSTGDGHIKSSNAQYNDEFNQVLNLNHPRLAGNRRSVIKGVVKVLGKKEWKCSDLKFKLNYYSGKTSNGQHPEYCGVVVWYLKKKLRKCCP